MTKNQTDETARVSDAKGGDHERIAKVLARAGLCSRREAEEWVTAGRVAIDGKVLTTPAVTVGAGSRVTVDGQPLPEKERTRLWLFHKPRGLVTTTSDPEGRPTVFSVLPDDMPRVITVGRLDINTEGLLLLTNDGGLARVLELPATGWLRRYRVRAYGEVEQAALDELKHGVSLDGIDYGSIEASIDRVQGANTWLVLGLREGKNREVKRVLGSLGLTVNRLIRISFGPFQLADLEEGEIREIRGRVLRDQLGKRLVAESGADFDAPIVHHVQGGEEAEEAPKRRIKAFSPATEGGDRAMRGDRNARGDFDRGERPRGDDRGGRGDGGDRPRGRTPRTKMEFIGTGERPRNDDRGDRGGAGGAGGRGGFGPRGGRPEGGRSDRPNRSEGFRGRPSGDEGKSGGFRDRPQGGDGAAKPRSEGFHSGGNRSEGFRGRPGGEGGDRPRSEGFRGRPGGGDAPKSSGFRDRPAGEDRPRGGAFRERPAGERSLGGGHRDRPAGGERPKSGGYRDRPQGDGPAKPRSEGFRDGGNRSEGYRGRSEGGDRPRSEGFRGRPDGEAPKSAGFRPRPEGGADRPKAAGFKPRPDNTGFGPRGPRGMAPGGQKGGRDGGEARDGARPARPEGRGGKPFAPRGDGPKGFKPRGDGPRGDRPRGDGPRGDGPKPFGPRGAGPKGGGPRSGGPKPGGAGRGGPRGGRP